MLIIFLLIWLYKIQIKSLIQYYYLLQDKGTNMHDGLRRLFFSNNNNNKIKDNNTVLKGYKTHVLNYQPYK